MVGIPDFSKRTVQFLFVAVLIALLVGGGVYLFKQRDDKQSSNTALGQSTIEVSPQPTPTQTPSTDSTSPAATGAGTYVEYEPDVLAKNPGKKYVLFFKASWCPTCQALDRNIKENPSSIPADTVIIKVDYDSASKATSEEIALKTKHKVTYQHTLVLVDSTGAEIKKWNNSFTVDEIAAQIS
jgi:thiol-disulfide isomerase/thioredoxin